MTRIEQLSREIKADIGQSGWRISKVKYVCNLYSGSTPSKENLAFWDGDVPWFSSQDLKSDLLEDSIEKITEEGQLADGLKTFPKGTLVGCFRSGILRHTFPVSQSSVEFTINQDVKAIVTSKGISPRFLQLYFQGQNGAILEMCVSKGATVERVELYEFLDFPVPLPSRAEQDSITEFLDVELSSIDSLSNNIAEQVLLLVRYKESIIHQVITQGVNEGQPTKDSHVEWIGNIPTHWEIKRLRYLVSKAERGTPPNYTELEGTKVVNQATFSRGFFDKSDIRLSSIPAKFSRGLLKSGDILLASTGGGVLGKTFLFHEEDTYVADSHVTVIRTLPSNCLPAYLHYWLSSNYRHINALMTKGSTNQTELVNIDLLDFEVPLPPLNEQHEIVDFLNVKIGEIDAVVEAKRKQARILADYRKSLIYEFVTGKKKVPAA